MTPMLLILRFDFQYKNVLRLPNYKPPPCFAVRSELKRERWGTLTLMGAEAIFAIFVEVVRGGAPQESVVTALRCTALVFGAHEQEREFTELPISVAELYLHHCGKITGSNWCLSTFLFTRFNKY